MKDKYFFDTNILIYAFDKNNKSMHEPCKNLLFEFIQNKNIYISSQVIGEFIHIFSNKLRKGILNASKLAENMIYAQNIEIFSISTTTLLKALELSNKYNIHFWDAQVAASMMENGINKIYTENTKDFNKVPSIEAINPISL